MNTTQQQNSLQQLKELTNKIIVRESSREAHEAIKPVKEEHYKEILEALKNIGKEATGKTIAKFSSLTYHQVMRRVSEMEKKQLIKVVGRCSEEVRRPLLWDLVNK